MFQKRYKDYMKEMEGIEESIEELVEKANRLNQDAEYALQFEPLMADPGDKCVIIDRGLLKNAVVKEVMPPMDKLRRMPTYLVEIEGVEYPSRVYAGEFVIQERANASR